MNRFFAVVGIAAFVAACSDTTIPDSSRQPHVAAKDGIPPPPPLSGSGDGFLFESDLVPQATVANGSLPLCSGPPFELHYDWSYLQPDPNNQQVVHLKLDGVPTNGEIILHQNQNGKSNAQGNISNGSFSFNLQSGDVIFLSSARFDFNVTGILTNPDGSKCQASGDLHGSLQGD